MCVKIDIYVHELKFIYLTYVLSVPIAGKKPKNVSIGKSISLLLNLTQTNTSQNCQSTVQVNFLL